jgi:hypothetical protein
LRALSDGALRDKKRAVIEDRVALSEQLRIAIAARAGAN